MTRHLPSILIAAAAAATVPACASERPADGAVSTWTVTPDLTIGGADDGPTSFSDIRGVAVDSRGRVYVLEAQEQQVRVFGPAGEFIRAVGRNGDGPGEFRGANGIAVDRAERLWVYDPLARRIAIFDSAGILEATHTIPISSRGYLWDGGVDSLGRVYDVQGMPVDTAYVSFIRRSDLAAQTADTLPWPDCGAERGPSFAFGSMKSGSSGFMDVPFASGRYRRLDPAGYVWCADTRSLRASRYRIGDTIPFQTISASAVPAPVTAAERDSAVAQVRAFEAKVGKGDPDFSLIPATKPVLVSIEMDDEGGTWVRAMTEGGTEYFVFDSAGDHIARVAFPSRPMAWLPVVIRGGRMYVTQPDSLDVPVVVRYVVGRRD
jgi:hypothetical protein